MIALHLYVHAPHTTRTPTVDCSLMQRRDKAAFWGAACQVESLRVLLFGSHDLSGDELLHDLVGAPVYGLHSGVGVCPSDAGLPHVSPPAVHLNALRGHGVLQLGGPVLDHGRGLKSWELV